MDQVGQGLQYFLAQPWLKWTQGTKLVKCEKKKFNRLKMKQFDLVCARSDKLIIFILLSDTTELP